MRPEWVKAVGKPRASGDDPTALMVYEDYTK